MLEIELNPFTELHTPRLVLREVQEKDALEILFFRTDERMMQYLDREKLPNLEAAREMIQNMQQALSKNEGINWGISLKDSDKLIGTIGLWRFIKANHRAEIGYALHPNFWQQGLMNEAMQAVLHYGFRTLKLHSIEANINPQNLASRKLLEKTGFVQEAYFREDYYFQGKFLDSVIFSLIDPESRKPSQFSGSEA